MRRMLIFAAAAGVVIVTAAMAYVVHYRMQSSEADALAEECSRDGKTRSTFARSLGGVVSFPHPYPETFFQRAAQLRGSSKLVVRNELGKPTYIAAHTSSPQFEGCEWRYLLRGTGGAGNKYVLEEDYVVGVWFDGEGRAFDIRREVTCRPWHPTYDEWRSRVTFPIVASAERKAKITAGYSHVNVGMTPSDITSFLGKPDLARVHREKTGNQDCTGRSYVYYLEKPSDETNETNDLKVAVFFDLNGRVHWITSNVPGLEEKGSPVRARTAPGEARK